MIMDGCNNLILFCIGHLGKKVGHLQIFSRNIQQHWRLGIKTCKIFSREAQYPE
ncbi:hypothetical protein Sjap_007620 [Stephania japonica]|uniref:Uncharacterized protein n=1 Tax=Stephania japonica TaxID=461633 RepID=A0AAP0JNV8_9MAGN